jgi:hypothetical protein
MADLTLVEIIRQKQRELAHAEERVAQLRAELAEAGEALGGGAVARSSAARLKAPGSSTEMAELVLEETGQPLHVNEIISGIEHHFGVSVRYATLVGNISRLIKQKRTFERVGPNRFGLIAWHAEREAHELFTREEYESENTAPGLEKLA